ncbi:MAG: hypothetical protein ACOWWO_12370 [Peptococcaceae bacterium]
MKKSICLTLIVLFVMSVFSGGAFASTKIEPSNILTETNRNLVNYLHKQSLNQMDSKDIIESIKSYYANSLLRNLNPNPNILSSYSMKIKEESITKNTVKISNNLFITFYNDGRTTVQIIEKVVPQVGINATETTQTLTCIWAQFVWSDFIYDLTITGNFMFDPDVNIVSPLSWASSDTRSKYITSVTDRDDGGEVTALDGSEAEIWAKGKFKYKWTGFSYTDKPRPTIECDGSGNYTLKPNETW